MQGITPYKELIMTKNNVKSVHHGHRDRLKQRFNVNQGRDFEDHELIEMLLFYVLPRVNTNDLAHKLIDKFGSLRNVCNADPARIEDVIGAGPSTAMFFSLLKAVRKRIDLQKYNMNNFVADGITKVGEYLIDYYKDADCEEICAFFLDNSFRLIEFSSLSQGSVNSASLDVRKLTKHALRTDATQVIIAHNHPNGSVDASIQDQDLTMQIDRSLRSIGVTLVEHIIVSDISYVPTMYLRTTSMNRIADINKYRHFYEN